MEQIAYMRITQNKDLFSKLLAYKHTVQKIYIKIKVQVKKRHRPG